MKRLSSVFIFFNADENLHTDSDAETVQPQVAKNVPENVYHITY